MLDSLTFSFKGLATSYAETLTGIYEFIAKEYVEDVYRDIIETYIISTIKVLDNLIKKEYSYHM